MSPASPRLKTFVWSKYCYTKADKKIFADQQQVRLGAENQIASQQGKRQNMTSKKMASRSIEA